MNEYLPSENTSVHVRSDIIAFFLLWHSVAQKQMVCYINFVLRLFIKKKERKENCKSIHFSLRCDWFSKLNWLGFELPWNRTVTVNNKWHRRGDLKERDQWKSLMDRGPLLPQRMLGLTDPESLKQICCKRKKKKKSTALCVSATGAAPGTEFRLAPLAP